MVSVSPSSGWQVFEHLQQSLQTQNRVNVRTWADDEALSDLLNAFLPSVPSPDDVNRRYYSLRRNRLRKHRNRKELFDFAATELSRCGEIENLSEKAGQRELLKHIHAEISSDDWSILCRRSEDFTFESIASDIGISSGALRTKICRLQKENRKQFQE